MAKNFVVAVELGSSKITGIAGKKNADGSINVLALAQEDSSSFINKGYVYNIDKTAQAISSVVSSLSNQLKAQIRKVYVGVGGQSLRGIGNTLIHDFRTETKVTQNMLFDLMDANRTTHYPEREILEVAVQEYKVDNLYQREPVGIECLRLVGSYLNITYRQSLLRSLSNCFAAADVLIEDIIPAPVALADVVLTETERRSGCVLVDLGADTTTVAVYYKNILRHLVVIPIGSHNITKDLTSLQMDESQAEAMKLKYGVAYTENSNIDLTLKYPIDAERTVDSSLFIEIIEARLQEIIENVKSQIPQEYEHKLMGGYILTGGGSCMKRIEAAFVKLTNTNKIRIAKSPAATVLSRAEKINLSDGLHNTILGLLAKGRDNCAGDEFQDGELFPTQQPTAATETTEQTIGSNSTLTSQMNAAGKQAETAEPGVKPTAPVETVFPEPSEIPEEADDEETVNTKGKKKSGGLSNFISFIKKMIEEE